LRRFLTPELCPEISGEGTVAAPSLSRAPRRRWLSGSHESVAFGAISIAHDEGAGVLFPQHAAKRPHCSSCLDHRWKSQARGAASL
jgi:hypothetical protein